jgi:predicted Zn-dependent protease
VARLLLVAAVGVVPAALSAQMRRSPPPEGTPRFLVNTLRATDKSLGVQAADAIRSRLTQDFPSRALWIIDKNNTCAVLEASGFACDVAPEPSTARQLAQQLRADEYLFGTVTRTDRGFRIESSMALTRDNTMIQPLPAAEGPRMLDAATQLSRTLQEARKQLAPEKQCETALADGKPAEAAQHARAAIAAYPRSTLGRVCLAQAMVNQKAPADSIIQVTQQALEMYPDLVPALRLAINAYTQAGNQDSMVALSTRLLALAYTDTRLVEELVGNIAAASNPRVALPIINDVLQKNPGDAQLMRLRFRLLLAAREWKEAAVAGEELVRTDTSHADTLFFRLLAVAYVTDSQPQKAAEVTARGVAKFPNAAHLWSLHSQILRQAGQTQQAMEAIRKALALDPKTQGGYTRLAQIQLEMGQSDSAFATLKQAVANGEDKELIGQIVVVEANKVLKQAQTTKARADWEKVVAIAAQADSIASSATSKFMLGVAAFQVGDAALRENVEARSCDLAMLADRMFVITQIELPKGASVQPQTAGQILQALLAYGPSLEGQKKQFCRS